MKVAEIDTSSKDELKFRITDKLILKVLEQIKNECWQRGDTCRGCPLYGNRGCALNGETPEEWDIEALTKPKDFKKKRKG